MPPLHVFLDFDGTITLQDTGNILMDHFMGYEDRRALDKKVISGELTFRQALAKMWSHVRLSIDEANELLKDVQLDPGFPEFLKYCRDHDIPVTIVSGGIDFLIHRILSDRLPNHGLPIFSNKATIASDKSWNIHFHDDSDHGHNKASHLQAIPSHIPTLFVGDGISDFPAALHARHVFARKNLDLEKYCRNQGISHHAFDTFFEILAVTQAILKDSEQCHAKE